VAAFVAVVVLVAGTPAASASQADLVRAQRRANAAAAQVAAAQTRLSRLESHLADLERRRADTLERLAGLQQALKSAAVERYINGDASSGAPTVDLSRDLSAEARAEVLASFVAAGREDATDAYRATAEDLEVEEAQLASTKKATAAALASYRARARAASAELGRLKKLETERIAREKAKRAAASKAPKRATGVLGSGSWICPVQGPRAFSNDFGDPRGGGRRRHQGNDILSPRGTPVVAPVSGSARHHENGLGGHSFYLTGSDGITYYGAHLDSYTSNVGQVAAGTVLGYVGNTGDARGGPTHLHFEMHPGGGGAVNPYATLRQYC
jgi:murein DD-endopeptidase MepM/ murein hydrolase activator NlpD